MDYKVKWLILMICFIHACSCRKYAVNLSKSKFGKEYTILNSTYLEFLFAHLALQPVTQDALNVTEPFKKENVFHVMPNHSQTLYTLSLNKSSGDYSNESFSLQNVDNSDKVGEKAQFYANSNLTEVGLSQNWTKATVLNSTNYDEIKNSSHAIQERPILINQAATTANFRTKNREYTKKVKLNFTRGKTSPFLYGSIKLINSTEQSNQLVK